MKTRKANPRKTSRPDLVLETRKVVCESTNNSYTYVKPDPISTIAKPDEKNSIVMVYNNSNNDNGPNASGVLDDFLNANGPLSVNIETVFPSADKTTSEMSCLTSPDFVRSFPDPETHSKTLPLHSISPGVNGELHTRACTGSKNLLWIKIESSNVHNSTSFCVPVSLMLQREIEMQAAARANKIGKERWTSSRIFRMWKSQCRRRQGRHQSQIEHGSQKCNTKNSDNIGDVFLRMTPEVNLHNSNSSYVFFRWKSWLTTCIRSYYNTGNLRIPNECTGDDILLALEYFGILTASPDDFIFDSSRAYDRIQAWSRYFTHRANFAESLLEAYDDAEVEGGDHHNRSLKAKSRLNLRKNLVWVLFKEKECVKDQYEYHVTGKITSDLKVEYETLLHSSSKAIRRLAVDEAGGLYDLFFGGKEKKQAINSKCTLGREYKAGAETNMISKEMPSRMRRDFCEYLKQSLPPWSSVQFDIERVEVAPISTTKREKSRKPAIECRPVLCVYSDSLQTATTTLKKEENNSIIDRLKSVEKLAGGEVVTLNQLSGDQQIPSRRTIEKASSLLDTSFNGHKWNCVQKTERQYRNYDPTSRGSFNTVDAINKLGPNVIETFNGSQQTHKPITHVNMELGDLRSVTSVLSEPIVDYSMVFSEISTTRKAIKHGTDKKWCQGGPPVLITAKKIVRERTGRVNQESNIIVAKGYEQLSSKPPRSDFDERIETPPRTTRNLRATPPWDLDPRSHEVEDKNNFRNNKKVDEAIVGKVNEGSSSKALGNRARATAESDVSEWDDENSDVKSTTGTTDSYGSWGQLLASVCEVIVPASSSNILSSSPIRHFTLSSSKSTSSTVASSDDGHQTCSGKDKNEMVSKPNGLVDQAKRMGNDLSNQFDELMKIAYNEKDRKRDHPNGQQSLSPILEEIPDMLSINTDEDCTLTSCLTSSVVGQPRKTRTPEKKFETFHKINTKYISDEISSNMIHADPKRKSSELDSVTNSTVTLPLHIDKRCGVQSVHDKQEVARKKVNVRSFSKGFKHSGSKLASSASATTSKSTAQAYSKENRYSRHENRFYS